MTDKVAKIAFKSEVECLNNIRSLKSLSRSLNREVDLKKLEPDKSNAKQGI